MLVAQINGIPEEGGMAGPPPDEPVEEQRALELTKIEKMHTAFLGTEEHRPLMKMETGMTSSGDFSCLQRLMLNIDEYVSVKLLMRIWGPRLAFVVRLLVVSSFFDDSISTSMHFMQHVEQISQGWCLKWLDAVSPTVATIAVFLLLCIGLLAQFLGSFFLLATLWPGIAIKALIGWILVQPFLYAQLSNLEFMAESLSLLGGLLMLYVHLQEEVHAAESSSSRSNKIPLGSSSAGNFKQLVGRLLLPTASLYHAGTVLASAFTLDETTNLGMYISSLSLFFVNTAMVIGLVVGCMLVATGLKSRMMALLLGLINIVYVFLQYPFFRFVYRSEGEWKVDEDAIWMPSVVLPKDVDPNITPWAMVEYHRYYFFLGLSTSGALLLLAHIGPGKVAMQADETLLPVVARAKD